VGSYDPSPLTPIFSCSFSGTPQTVRRLTRCKFRNALRADCGRALIHSFTGIFSRAYLFASTCLVIFYIFSNIGFHRKLWEVSKQSASHSEQILDQVHDHSAGLRQAEHVALGIGRALFASQLSILLLGFSPRFRATDSEPWLSVPEFLLVCQTAFLPVLTLLILDWLLCTHLRAVTRSH
jgi:hypothetical protein